jgi:Mannosyltransferase (PIG-V)
VTVAPPEPGAPRWVRAADALAITFVVLAIFTLIFGGFALHLGPVPLRVRSPARLLFLFAAIVAIRHAAHSGTPLHHRLLRRRRAADGSAAAIARTALVSRIAVLIVGYFAVVTIGLDPTGGFEVSPDKAFSLPVRFDAGWYGGIALEGYSFEGRFDRQQNVAFFPAFPLLMRGLGYPLGAFEPSVPRDRRMGRVLWGGVIISLIAFAWGAIYTWRLARDTIGEDRAAAAVALMGAYPFAVFYSAPYTESLFLLGAAGAVYHFRRNELAAAAAWGLLVGLTRPNGCFLSIVLAVLLVERVRRDSLGKSSNPELTKSLAAAAAPGIGMLLYSAYVHQLTGSWFGWARLHEAWGRSYEGLAPVARAYGWLSEEGLLHVVEGVPYDTLNSLGLIFALLMLWPVLRRLGVAYVLFMLANVIPPLLAGGVLSMGRITATLFPLFLALAAVTPPRAITPLVTAFAIGQGLAAALFFTWRPLF